jgi:membrane associated rhomboid family serine protease
MGPIMAEVFNHLMQVQENPKWYKFLSKNIGFIGIPNIAIIFVTLQALGFFLVLNDSIWITRLSLIPEKVMQGEYWRTVTYLALPLSNHPVWMIFTLGFLYYILNSIEAEWGEFKTTLYILISILLTIAFSLTTDYPVENARDFVSTLFLAVAALYPEREIQVYFFIPVKMKVMGYLALFFLAFRLIGGDWLDRLFLLSIYSNYFLFFGPSLLYQLKEWRRRRAYRAKW